MEQNDLSITSTHCDLIAGHSLDALDALRANILCEYKQLVFDLEAAEIATECARKEEFLCGLAEG
jgi:hypothetical protein